MKDFIKKLARRKVIVLALSAAGLGFLSPELIELIVIVAETAAAA